MHVCSFAKCGRTWLRYALAQYCQLLFGTNLPIGFANLGKVFNDTEMDPREEEYNVFPDVVFTHSAPTDQIRKSRRVMLVRRCMDMMVSYYHHISADKPDCLDAISLIKTQLTPQWTSYINKWCREDNTGVLWLQYEELGTEDCWHRFLNYAGIPLDENKLRQALERSTFQKMLEDEKKHPMNKSSNPNHRRVRNGLVDGWVHEISEADAKQLVQAARSQLTPEASSILQPFGIFDFRKIQSST